MKIDKSKYLNSLKPYAFAEVEEAKKKAEREYSGKVIDFGVGDPTEPTPAIAVSEGIKEAVIHPERGYPSYEGEMNYREAVSEWFERRFNVKLNPEKEITATLGSKQAVFSLPMAYVNRGDCVLVPDPGYPPYTTGAKQRGAKPILMPLKEENDFLPKVTELDEKEVQKAKIMWINYPNNPTTKIAPKRFLKKTVDFCKENDIILVSDEAYSEMYYDDGKKPISLFNIGDGREVGLVFHSLSKRSNMTNYRIGFVAGRKELLDPFKKVQTNLHSGQSQILQYAAIGALSDESHVEKMRALYQKKKDKLLPALEKTGFSKVYAEGTFYLWAKIPKGNTSLNTVKNLLEVKGINATPGGAVAQKSENGDNFLRFALVPSLKDISIAVDRLTENNIFE